MVSFEGGCHCGAITVRFSTAQPADVLVPRADQCGFCRKHNAAVISDPAGRLVVTVSERAGPSYRFGLGITDFHVCKGCGVFVAATRLDGNAVFGVVNLYSLDDGAPFSQLAEKVSFEGENTAERQARRRVRWTPAEVRHGT